MTEREARSAPGETRHWWSRALAVAALLAFLCLPLGALGTRFGLWPFQLGGATTLLGTAVAALMLLTSSLLLSMAYVRRGLNADKANLWRSVLVAGATVAIVAAQIAPAASYPRIHNITTDVDDPPKFDEVIVLRAGSNPQTYDQALAEIQRAAYPDIEPLVLESGSHEVFDRALGVVQDLGLDLVDVNPGAGTIEATDTSFWFGFKDDVVIRVRAADGGTVVDIRSVSRVGQSDLGANAARIADILDRIQRRN